MSGTLIATVTVSSTITIKYTGGGGIVDWVSTIGTSGTVAVDSSPNGGTDYLEEVPAANSVNNIVVNYGVPPRLYKFTIVAGGGTSLKFYASGSFDTDSVVIT